MQDDFTDDMSEFERDMLEYRWDCSTGQIIKRKRPHRTSTPIYKEIKRRFRKTIDWPLRQIAPNELNLLLAPYRKRANVITDAYESRDILQFIVNQQYSEVLNAIGSFSFLCSLIEGRIHAMYENRRALILGEDITIEQEESNHYSFLQGSEDLKHNRISIEEALNLLRIYNDIDEDFLKEIRIYQKIRNSLIHEAFIRRDKISPDMLNLFVQYYKILVKYRDLQRAMIKKERDHFKNENAHEMSLRKFKEGSSHLRETIYKYLAGSIDESVSVPFRFGVPAYVIFHRVIKNDVNVKSSIIVNSKLFILNDVKHFKVPCFIDGGKSKLHKYLGCKMVAVQLTKDGTIQVKYSELS